MQLQTWKQRLASWAVTILGAILLAVGGTFLTRAPDFATTVQVGMPIVIGIDLVVGGLRLRASHPSDHIVPVAAWVVVGSVVGIAAASWIGFVLAVAQTPVDDPTVLGLNGAAIFMAVFSVLGYYATNVGRRGRALDQAQARFRALTENAQFVVVTVDEAGTIRYTNDTVTDVFGYDVDDLVGEPLTTILQAPSEGADQSTPESPPRDEAPPFEWNNDELVGCRVDGETVPVTANFGAYTDDGTKLFTGVIHDISTRQATEARIEEHSRKVADLHRIATDIAGAETSEAIHQHAVDGAVELFDCDDAVVALHDNGRFNVVASAPAASTRAEESFTDRLVYPNDCFRASDVVRIDDLAATRSIATTSRDSDDVDSDESEAGSDDPSSDRTDRAFMCVPIGDYGILQVFDGDSSAFSVDDEEIASLLAAHVKTALDHVVTEASLRQERDRFEEFASILSHDIRNPLTVAQGRLHLARQTDDTDVHLEYIEQAHDRIERLIDGILSLARQGDAVGTTESVRLKRVATEAWDNVATRSATFEIVDECVFEADRTRLLQVFENLYRNAVEHGGDDVTITIGRLDDGFYIEDTGPGIHLEDQDRIFDSGYSSRDDGTGLGLAIVEEIVAAHGWQITVTEGSDGGARFEITGVEIRD